jgi:5'-nucleotidase
MAFINPGGVRSSLSKGDIVYADLVTVIPFENVYNTIELSGKAIRETLEFSVSNTTRLTVMQVAGLRVVYDLSRKPYERIIDLKVNCQTCDVPRYTEIENLKFYKVVLPEYVALGGDGFTMIPEHSRNRTIGPRDVDALVDYVVKNSPIALPPISKRIVFV